MRFLATLQRWARVNTFVVLWVSLVGGRPVPLEPSESVIADFSAREAPRLPAGRRHRMNPPQHAWQTQAFSRYRFAQLDEGKLRVFRLRDFSLVLQVDVVGARNVVVLPGGSFLVPGARRLLRVSPTAVRGRSFAPVPRLGATTIYPSPVRSEKFALLYEGITTLSHFQLGATAGHFLPVVNWLKVAAFDSRAIARLDDSSWVFTDEGGLMLLFQGAVKALSREPWSREVWALVRSGRGAEVLAFSKREAFLLDLHKGADPVVARRWTLPKYVVAVDARAGRVAALSGRRSLGRVSSARVDVWELATLEHWGVPLPLESERGEGWTGSTGEKRPEVSLAPRDPFVSARGLAGGIYNYRTNRLIWRSDQTVRNLAKVPD